VRLDGSVSRFTTMVVKSRCMASSALIFKSALRRCEAHPVITGVLIIVFTTVVLEIIDKWPTHPQNLEHLMLGYMVPVTALAMMLGSRAGVIASVASALLAAFFFFPPPYSLWIDKFDHVAECFWMTVLFITASKAAGGMGRRASGDVNSERSIHL
jgi:K+-sensing histidine kinase KdpD